MGWWEKLFSSLKPAAPAAVSPDVHQPASRSEAEILALLTPHERTAWLPQTVEEDHGAAASKFGGMALVTSEQPAPVCLNCRQPMPLLVQLNPADLPAEQAVGLYGKMLQLFYCTSEEAGCEPWMNDGRGIVTRLVPIEEPVIGVLPANSFPAQTIIGWQPQPDQPYPDEWDELGVETSGDEMEAVETSEQFSCSTQDKLGGWPYWIQGAEYFRCRHCGQRMDVLFQLASEDHLPYMFGDGGIGHIHQCQQHPEELTFNWSCH